jgi:hypothetical protein
MSAEPLFYHTFEIALIALSILVLGTVAVYG